MVNPLSTIITKPTRKVGFVLKPHGYKGHLRLAFDDDYDVIKGEFLFLEIQNKWVPFLISETGQDGSIVKLEDVDTQQAAEALAKCSILAFESENDEVESEDELIGYRITDEAAGFEAEVTGIIDMPGHSLIETRWNYKEVLIPLHESIIIEINHENKTIKANLPEGLLDL